MDILTSIGYVFLVPGSENGGGPFSSDLFPNASFTASDSEFGGLGYDEIAPGDSYGLAHVSYIVDANAASGDRPLILDTLGTSLSDENGDAVDFMSVNGNMHVDGDVSVVPEPSTGVLLSMGLVCAMFAIYRRARRNSFVSSAG